MSSRKKAFTLIELLVVVAIIALLISILLPSLTKAKEITKSILCASHLKSCAFAWQTYSNDFEGKWVAIWDRSQQYSWATGNNVSIQAPCIMWYYTLGESLPGPSYKAGHGWWNPYAHAYGSFNLYNEPKYKDNPSYHCPVAAETPSISTRSMWRDITAYSIFIPEEMNSSGTWASADSDYYPKPDLFTHSGSTGVLTCLNGIYTEGTYNAWCKYEGWPSDPHGNESNYLFADSHVEKLSTSEVNQLMWRPMWEPQ